MGLSNSVAMYEDMEAILNKALESEYGVKVECATHGEAIHMRQKCYKLRQIWRSHSLRIYNEDDIQRGTSMYDSLLLRVEGPNLVIKKRDAAQALKNVVPLGEFD